MFKNQNINYNHKYLKYKKKYYELKHEYNLIGGKSKSSITYDELRDKLIKLAKTPQIIKNNLAKFYNEKIKHLNIILHEKKSNDIKRFRK